MPGQADTSWEKVAPWYDALVGEKGSYFHTHVIFPRLLPLLNLKPEMKVLDMACGQGAWARKLAEKGAKVTGVDMSESLIRAAKQFKTPNTEFVVDDARSLPSLEGQKFDRITCILALQNMDSVENLFKRIHELLLDGGRFVAVLMHPCFRSPRLSGWGIDSDRKLMYRRVDRYLTPLKVPITTHPGQNESEVTWAFHRPLSEYFKYSRQAHLYCDAMEEWVSDRVSSGKNAQMENLAREEIPLFLAMRLKRIDHA